MDSKYLPPAIPVEWGAGYQHITRTGLPVHQMGGTFYVREGEDVAKAAAEFLNPERQRDRGTRKIEAWDAFDRRVLATGEVFIYSRYPRRA